MRRLLSLIMAGLICLALVHTGAAMAHELGDATHAAAHADRAHPPAPHQEPDDQDGNRWGVHHAHDATSHLQAVAPAAVLIRHDARGEALATAPFRDLRRAQVGGIDRPPRA